MSNATPTISSLNANDNAREIGGSLLSDDGCNQLWLFGDKVANRFENDDGEIFWSDDVTGWNHDPATDCIPA